MVGQSGRSGRSGRPATGPDRTGQPSRPAPGQSGWPGRPVKFSCKIYNSFSFPAFRSGRPGRSDTWSTWKKNCSRPLVDLANLADPTPLVGRANISGISNVNFLNFGD